MKGARNERAKRRLSVREVGPLVVRRLRVKAPTGLFEELADSRCGALRDDGDLLWGEIIELVELECAVVISHEDTIEEERVDAPAPLGRAPSLPGGGARCGERRAPADARAERLQAVPPNSRGKTRANCAFSFSLWE